MGFGTSRLQERYLFTFLKSKSNLVKMEKIFFGEILQFLLYIMMGIWGDSLPTCTTSKIKIHLGCQLPTWFSNNPFPLFFQGLFYYIHMRQEDILTAKNVGKNMIIFEKQTY